MKTWAQAAVLELEARGMTLTAIAEQTGLSLGSVSDLKQLRTAQPNGMGAIRLHELHARICDESKKAA